MSLWANKLRSALTLLGVVIGVAAVIAVVTFVNGINGYVAEKIFNLGADVFIISKVTPVITNVDQLLEGQKRKDLTMEDYQAVLESCRHCAMIGASTINTTGHVRYEEQSITDTWIRGLTPSMAPILDLDLTAGRMVNENDEENRSQVGVIGTDVVDNLFPTVDPLGKEIRVEGEVYRVIGVGKKQGTTLGQSRDNYVAIPITTYLKQFGSHTSIRISGKANGVGTELDAAIDEARAVLRARRHDLPGRPDSFAAETNASFLSIWSNLSGTFFIAMIAIAGDFAGGGRHRDHEHHAGVGHRADARDRHTKSDGSAPPGCAAAVPDRVRNHGAGGRPAGRAVRHRLCQGHHGDHRHAF